MVEVGKIERPDVEDYVGKRKLYCVANIYTIEEAPDDLKKLVSKYWDEVFKQIDKLESAGKIKKIFCEIIYQDGEEALEVLSRINERISQIVRKKIEEGGILFPLEKEEIIGPYTDWSNCLRVVYTEEVFKKVFEFYTEISNKRLEHILEIIDKNLAQAEAGLLIMKDEDRARLQFPRDIEVFLVTPPSYDDIIRWFREKLGKKSREKE